jgi:signal recognition particle receptor subunit beta
MVVLNYTGEEINAKIVYYGPGLSGKTTNLEYLYGQMPADSKGQMVSMKTRTDRTLFFDFFPLELGEINGYRARFLLYTVPGQVYYNATRKLVLKGADAVVFVADSARDKLQENIESLRNLEDNLNEHGLTLDDIPWVIQYNKRDVDDPMPVAELHQHLNLMNVPAFEAIAMTGFGVYDTFKGIAGILFRQLKEKLESGEAIPAATADAGDPAGQPGASSPKNVDDAVDSALREMGPAAPADTRPAAPVDKDAPVPMLPPVQPVPLPEPAAAPAAEPWSPVPAATEPATSPAAQPEYAPPASETAAQSDAEAVPEPSREQSSPQQHVSPAPQPAQQPDLPSPTPAAEPPAASTPPAKEPKPVPDAETLSLGSRAVGAAPDVGRLVELDESPESSGPADDGPSEFITDPMRPGSTEDEEPAEIEQQEGPVVTDRKADVHEQEVVVPVVISRSQVRKSVPLKLRLEIRVVDD